jgi:hypothetical protein
VNANPKGGCNFSHFQSLCSQFNYFLSHSSFNNVGGFQITYLYKYQ